MPPKQKKPKAPKGIESLYQQYLEGDLDLESLPSRQMMELMNKLRQDFEQALEMQEHLAGHLASDMRCRYIIDPPYLQEGVSDDIWKLRASVVKKWTLGMQPGSKDLQTISMSLDQKSGRELKYDQDSARIVLKPTINQKTESSHVDLERVMSSALLMYRVACLFPEKMECFNDFDPCKGMWGVSVVHNASMIQIEMGEHKAAARVWPLVIPGDDSVPESFRQDLLELVNLLFSPTCPHTYGGIVAGSADAIWRGEDSE